MFLSLSFVQQLTQSYVPELGLHTIADSQVLLLPVFHSNSAKPNT
jgi:hypothetical protein